MTTKTMAPSTHHGFQGKGGLQYAPQSKLSADSRQGRSGSRRVKRERDASPQAQASETGSTGDAKRVKNEFLEAPRKEDDLEWRLLIDEAITFRPTEEEFEDPFEYLEKITKEASKYGICKIVPPKSMKAAVPAGQVLKRAKWSFTSNIQHLGVHRPKKNGNGALLKKFFKSGRKYNLETFEAMAKKEMVKKFGCAGNQQIDMVEKAFWKEMLKYPNSKTVEYGSDQEGSGFSKSKADGCPLAQSQWNLRTFAKANSSSLSHLDAEIPGVTCPMLYCGMLYSQFAWHVEDNFLNSINFHHLGAPKCWYGVPSSDAAKFDQVASEHVFQIEAEEEAAAEEVQDRAASNFINKTTMFCPKLLIENGVRVYRIVQNPGEYVLTFPQAYHGGFSTGFNLGEAVNFATRNWYKYGIEAEKRYQRLKLAPVVSVEELMCADFHKRKCETAKPAEHSNRLDFNLFAATFIKIEQFVATIKHLKNGAEVQARVMSERCPSLPCARCSCSCYMSMYINSNDSDPYCSTCIKSVPDKPKLYTVFWNPILCDLVSDMLRSPNPMLKKSEIRETIENFRECLIAARRPNRYITDEMVEALGKFGGSMHLMTRYARSRRTI